MRRHPWLMVIPVIGLMAGCSAPSLSSTASATTPPVTVLLVESSAPKLAPDIRAHYLQQARAAIATTAGEDGVLIPDWIGPDTQISDQEATTFSFVPPPELHGVPLYVQHWRSQHLQAALTVVRGLIDGRPATPTLDVLGGLRVASRVMAQYPQARLHRLVLLTSMADTAVMSALGSSPSPTSITMFVQKLEATGRLPNLQGAVVEVSGAGIAGGKGTTRQAQALEAAWRAIIAAAGGRIPPGDYAAGLDSF